VALALITLDKARRYLAQAHNFNAARMRKASILAFWSLLGRTFHSIYFNKRSELPRLGDVQA
jgi:hypothetical protein